MSSRNLYHRRCWGLCVDYKDQEEDNPMIILALMHCVVFQFNFNETR